MEILERLKPLALLLLRVGIGIVFIFHGYPKLFTHTHDMMPAFQRMGFPAVLRLYRGRHRIFRRNRLDSRTIHAHRRAATGGRNGDSGPQGAFAAGADHRS